MKSLRAECYASYRPIVFHAAAKRARDFPSRRVRKKPSQADVDEFKAKYSELRRLATAQE